MTTDTDRPAILFVCLGNICRSPMADGAMQAEADRLGLDLHIDSAGTGSWHIGNPPDPRAIAAAARTGVDISNLRARQVAVEDHYRFTHILALDAQNLADIRAAAPSDGTARVSLLMDLVQGREGQAVADPYYGGDEGFDETWADVSAAARALAQQLAA